MNQADAIVELPKLADLPVSYSSRIISIPLDPKIITRHYQIETIEMVLLLVEDASGGMGLATLWCFGLPQATVLTQTLRYLAPIALRTRSLHILDILKELRREINFFGFKGVSVFALSAFDMALTDLTCRRANCSLGSVLGRLRADVPAYWSGLFGNQSQALIMAEVDQKLSEGFKAMKLRVGNSSLNEDFARIEGVIARLPKDGVLMLDAVQSWSLSEAIRAVDRMKGMPIHWLEDPLIHNDYAGLAKLVERSTIPIATGENEYLVDGFEQIFDAHPNYLLADLERVGGIHEWQILAQIAKQRAVILTPHVYPHIALQLCGALDQSECWIEYLPWWNQISSEQIRLTNGNISIPDIPGAGFNPDMSRIDALAITPWIELAE